MQFCFIAVSVLSQRVSSVFLRSLMAKIGRKRVAIAFLTFLAMLGQRTVWGTLAGLLEKCTCVCVQTA